MNSVTPRSVFVMVLMGWMLKGPSEANAQAPSVGVGNRFMFGIHYGAPLKWSTALAASFAGDDKDSKAFVAAEPGIGGWRGSVGYLKITSNLGSGYVLRGTVLRTNNKAWRAGSQLTFAGAEFQFMPLFALGARVGGFVRIGGQGERRGLLTADVSLML